MRAIDADAFKEYIRGACEDMKHLFKDNADFAKLITESFCKDIDEQPTVSAEPHWIPVEHDLPKENYLDDGYVEPSQPVLVYMNYHTCKTSRYWGHRKSKGTSDYVIPDWMDLEEYDGENVIAWMPLPEPYKGVTE